MISLDTLKYTLDKPNGKYEIPILFCYNDERLNRVMITVSNLFLILNDALAKVKQIVSKLPGIITDTINMKLENIENELIFADSNKVDLLSEKTKLINAKKKVPTFIKRIKNFKPLDDIVDFKKLVSLVTVNAIDKYEIKLNVINDNSSLDILYDQLNLKMKYKEQDVYYMVTI